MAVLTGRAGRWLARTAACTALAAAGLAAAAVPASALTAAAPPAAVPAAAPGPGVPTQVRAAEQAQLRAVRARAAWRVTRGRGVTVGVLDTGADPTAADLAGSVRTGPDYTLGANPPGYRPPHLHGTFIASLIAGHGSGPGRAGGVLGVAPAAKVLSVRVIPDDQEPGFALYNASDRFGDALGKGIRYAVAHGADVINMSLGSTAASRSTRAAIGYAISHGVVLVAAAGNGGVAHGGYSPYSYPASYPGVISVAALNPRGSRAYFSQRNSSVLVGAPGVNIVGAGPRGTYVEASGTSPAAAFVTGVAALIRAAYPRLSPALVTQALVASTRHRPAAGYGPATGYGEVSAPAALRAAGRLAGAHPAPGMAASAHFGGVTPGPIQVVHRDASRIAVAGGIGLAGLAGFAGALVVLAVLARRGRRDRRRIREHQPPSGGAGPAGPGALPGGLPGPAWPGDALP